MLGTSTSVKRQCFFYKKINKTEHNRTHARKKQTHTHMYNHQPEQQPNSNRLSI